MKIGIPKEIKRKESGVWLVPAGVEALVSAGHTVIVEAGAGGGSGFSDARYQAAGAQIAKDADAVWAAAGLIVKVKEPIAPEWKRIKPGQIIFTYFHFAASEQLTRAHIASGAACIAYETVELPSRELPLLTPMSEVAGRMAVQEGAKYLEKLYGGRGVLLGGVPGVAPAQGDHPRRLTRTAALPQRRDAGQRPAHLLEPAQHPRADQYGGSRGRRRADS